MAENTEVKVVKPTKEEKAAKRAEKKAARKAWWGNHKKLSKGLKISGIVTGVAAVGAGAYLLISKFCGKSAAAE